AEEVLRVVRTAQVGQQEGDVLRRVTGRRHAADAQPSDGDRLPVGEGDVRVANARVRAGDHGDRPDLREGGRTGDVVVVHVRLEGMRDEDAELRGPVEVRLEMTVRVDQEGDALVGIGDEIGSVTQTCVEELL